MSALIPFIKRSTLNNWVYDMDRIFDAPLSSTLTLQGDIEETADYISLSFDFPGMKDGDFSVQVQDDKLIISGERKREEKDIKEGEGYAYYGRQYGKFQKTFVLPSTVDKARVEAEYEAGVLKIVLPKAEEQKPKQIEVKVKSK